MLPAALTWFTRNRKAPVVEEPRVLIEPRAAMAFADVEIAEEPMRRAA
jgi:hypothetical protein